MGHVEETLDEIGRRFQCDKSSLAHDYLRGYALAFTAVRAHRPVILEIGWNDLSSLAVWATYFPNGTVIGSFAHRPATAPDAPFTIDVGDPNDPAYLVSLVDRFNPDVVIDDASHRWKQQKSALRTMLPILKPGALYIIEDLQTSFVDTKDYAEGSAPQQSTARYLQDLLAGLMSGGTVFAPEADSFQVLAPSLVESMRFDRKICFVTRSATVLHQVTVVKEAPEERQTALAGEASYLRVAAEIDGLDPAAKDQFDRESKRGRITAPAPLVSEIEDAVVYGRGVVTTRGRKLLADSLINVYGNEERFEGLIRLPGSNRVLAPYDADAPVYGEERPAILLKQRWDANYGHWLVESLPRLATARQVCDLDRCEVIIGKAGPAMNRVYLDTLRLAGVNLDRVRATDDVAIRVKRLIYPHPLTIQPWVKSPVVIAFLEEMRDRVGPAADASDRVFVRRSRSSRRRLLNEQAVLAVAERHGFKPLSVDGMTFEQQVAAFSAAHLVVGTLGAELTNLVFSPKGVSLFGLSPRTMQDDFYYDLICHKGGRYHSLHGAPTPPDAPGLEADFQIDPARFEAMLRKFVGS